MLCVSLQTCAIVCNVVERGTENAPQSQRNWEQSSTQFRMELDGLRTEEVVCLGA